MERKYILPYQVKDLQEIPFHWRLDKEDIDDKIKVLRKQIYELQNSRKNQPKLITFEGKDKVEKVRIFDGWEIIDENKGVFCADSWHYPSDREKKELLDTFNFTDEVKDILNYSQKDGKVSQ